MKKLLQFTSVFICALLFCFFVTPTNTKAESEPDHIARLRTANVPAAARDISAHTSSGITTPQEYVVTFNTNYGTISGSRSQTTVNQRLTSLPTAVRSGYTFRGWYTQSSGGDRITTSYIFNRNTDVYAQWDNYELNFRDIFVANISDTSVTVTAIIPSNTYIRNWGVSYGTANNYLSLTRETNLYATTSALSTSLTGLTPNTTYYYRLYYVADTIRIESGIGSFTTSRATEYNVTFYPNGGTVNGQSVYSTSNLKIPYLPSAYRDGYNFDGWYTEPYGGSLITVDTVFRSNSTVYAHWTATQNNGTSNSTTPAPGNTNTNNGTSNNGTVNNGNTSSGSSSSSGSDSYDYEEPVSVQRVKLKSITNNPPRRMKVKWRWYAYGDGYQIAYSTSKNFASNKTKKISAGVFTDAKTIAGLTKGKTYYVRVRAFQKVGGKKFYGAWSNVKKIKIKK